MGYKGTVFIAGNPAVGNYSKVFAVVPGGSLSWSYLPGYKAPGLSCVMGPNGVLYYGAEQYLYAMNPGGTFNWRYLTGGWVTSTPAIGADGLIYVGSGDHKLYALNPQGAKQWEFTASGQVDSSPIIATDGTIYVGSLDGKLYAINSSSKGLASSGWPAFHYDSRRSGKSLLRSLCPIYLLLNS
jgi:outer membrane protein assembly factor BamB